MFYVWAAAGTVGLSLQVLLIAALLRGAYKRYGVLFAYSIVLLATTAVEARAFLSASYAVAPSTYYWISDTVRQSLLFLLVISLIHSATMQSPLRALIRRWLVLGLVLVVALSLFLTYSPQPNRWMTEFSRNLGFVAVVLNLVLWMALIKAKRPDNTLLKISGGMGIQMAGKAIGHSLRQLSRTSIVTGDLIIVLSHLVCLYIWWQAFRRLPRSEGERTDALARIRQPH